MTSTDIELVFATQNDLGAMTEIYNYYVLNSAITFDTTPFSVEQRQPWFDQFMPNSIHQCLVAKQYGKVLGYTSSSKLRPKPAYDSSVETTIYLHPDAVGMGLGSKLYGALFNNLSKLDVHRLYGIVALPNDRSLQLHRRFGFSQIGVLNEVGFKFGRYHDTAWLERKFENSSEASLEGNSEGSSDGSSVKKPRDADE
tara:strand:- start:4632 stop:5225 length:594 start_codon:yes stop_codon:yes gene_type:complete